MNEYTALFEVLRYLINGAYLSPFDVHSRTKRIKLGLMKRVSTKVYMLQSEVIGYCNLNQFVSLCVLNHPWCVSGGFIVWKYGLLHGKRILNAIEYSQPYSKTALVYINGLYVKSSKYQHELLKSSYKFLSLICFQF